MNKINEENYVEEAEKAIEILKSRKDKRGRDIEMVTTSKIRNLLAMTMDIYNQILEEEEGPLRDEIKGRVEYLRVRFIYEAGREKKVKYFTEVSKTIDILKEISEKKDYLLFTRYMESLVSFHRYLGGKDM